MPDFLIAPAVAQQLCGFPDRLHPVSETILHGFLGGLLSQPDFLRFFSLPNSDYIALAACLVKIMNFGVPGV